MDNELGLLWHSCTLSFSVENNKESYNILPTTYPAPSPFTKADTVTAVFDEQFTAEKVQGELGVFQSEANKIFERTYGWAWLLKLQQELLSSPLDQEHGQEWNE